MGQRKTFSSSQKAKIAREAMRGDTKINDIAGRYDVHPIQVKTWKRTAEKELEALFTDKRKKPDKEKDELIAELYRLVGKRDTELEWLKKKMQYLHT